MFARTSQTESWTAFQTTRPPVRTTKRSYKPFEIFQWKRQFGVQRQRNECTPWKNNSHYSRNYLRHHPRQCHKLQIGSWGHPYTTPRITHVIPNVHHLSIKALMYPHTAVQHRHSQ